MARTINAADLAALTGPNQSESSSGATAVQTSPPERHCVRCGEQLHREEGKHCFACVRFSWDVDRLWRNSGVAERHAELADFAKLGGGDDFEAARDDVRVFGRTGSSVLGLIGNRGTGKTQLACAAIREVVAAGRAARIVTAMGIMADLKRRFGERDDYGGADGEHNWIAEWGAPHLLCVDEWQARTPSEYAGASLTELVDKRYRERKPTIIIANCEPADFPALVGASIADRCNEGGGLIHCDWPSFRGRCERLA